MYIDEFCGSWMDHPFWRTRFLIRSDADLEKIHSSGVQEVWIDASKGLDCAGAPASADRAETQSRVEDELRSVASAGPGAAQRKSEISAEFERATKILRQSRSAVSQLFGEARLGKVGSADTARAVVADIADSVSRHPSALIGLARLKTADDYTFMHSMAASALMVALARALGHDEQRVNDAGMAGLLHDVGKAHIPLSILNKPDTLNEEEWQLMRSHPERGHAALQAVQDVPAEALDAVLHHHEKMDGSGYPHRLPGDRICELARMTAICDVYDAVTSDRAYKAGWEPTVAVRKMAEWKGHFDEKLFKCFVRTVGIYPLGSLVRLKSQRLAVVVDHDPAHLLQPVVKVFFSLKSKVHIEPFLVNLEKTQTDRIVNCEDPASYGFKHLPELWLPPGAVAAKAPA
jgi:HD-GYP domain-containing protein (c-di-GMP phosphodiesterase class II)